MITRWNDRRQQATLENLVSSEDGHLGVDLPGKGITVLKSLDGVVRVIDPEALIDLEITISSSGYYDEGNISGPLENCYPPEGADEREIVQAELVLWEQVELGPNSHGYNKLICIPVSNDRLSKLTDDLYDFIEQIEFDDVPDEDPRH